MTAKKSKTHDDHDTVLGTGACGDLDNPGKSHPGEHGTLQPAGDDGTTTHTTDSDVVAGEAGQGA